MIKDLRSLVRYGTLVRCYLAEDSKRITSSTFKVYIPSLMPSIENTGNDSESDVNVDRCLNQGNSFHNTKVNLPSYIVAKSSHNYMHRLDGWIPEFKTETETNESIKSSSTDGTSDTVGAHPGKPITQPMTLFKNTIKNTVHTNNTEVDFQELNRYFIKRGHPMIGTFLEGEEFEFRILFIDGATPYLDEVSDKGSNGDNPFNFVSGGEK